MQPNLPANVWDIKNRSTQEILPLLGFVLILFNVVSYYSGDLPAFSLLLTLSAMVGEDETRVLNEKEEVQ